MLGPKVALHQTFAAGVLEPENFAAQKIDRNHIGTTVGVDVVDRIAVAADVSVIVFDDPQRPRCPAWIVIPIPTRNDIDFSVAIQIGDIATFVAVLSQDLDIKANRMTRERCGTETSKNA